MVGKGEAAECNSVFADNCTVSTSMTLSNIYGQYNDTPTVNGFIRINANNLILTCSNVTIWGNNQTNSRAIDVNFNSNITIKNCAFADYNWGVYSSGGNNIQLINNTIGHMMGYGLYTLNGNNSLFENNTISNSDQYGIACDASPYNDSKAMCTVRNNIISSTTKDGILVQGNGRSLIENNTLSNAGLTTFMGIKLVTTNTTIVRGNVVTNSNESGIAGAIDGYYNQIYNNTISGSRDCLKTIGILSNYSSNVLLNCRHDAIDMNAGYGNAVVDSKYINIYNNFISGSLIYINDCDSCNIYNNNLSNVNQNDVSSTYAISIEGNKTELFNSQVYNNYITLGNASIFFYSGNVNGTWYNNTLIGEGNHTIMNYFDNNTQVNQNIIANNSYQRTSTLFFLRNNIGASNYFIYENTTFDITTQLPINANTKANFNYSGLKNVYINNATINLSFNSPYQDIKNLSSNNFVYANVNNFTVNSGDSLSVLDGSCDTIPVAETITSNRSYCSGTYNFSGNGVLTNAHDLSINFNGGIWVGNGSGSGVSAQDFNRNITIANGTLINFFRGISALRNNTKVINMKVYNSSNSDLLVSNNPSDKITIRDSIFWINSSSTGINFLANVSSSLITNNSFYGKNANFLFAIGLSEASNNNTITNNNFYQTDGVQINGQTLNCTANTIKDNYFYNANASTSDGVLIRNNVGSNYVYNNTMNNTFSQIRLQLAYGYTLIENNSMSNNTGKSPSIAWIYLDRANNTVINNNFLNFSDSAITLKTGQNISITNNRINNSITFTDFWGNGIRIEYNSSQILIADNKIDNSAGASLMIRQSRDINVTRNSFDSLPIASRNLLGKAMYEPNYGSCMDITELYLGFIGDSSESASDTITKISGYHSNNISLSNNVCGDNSKILLVTQGTSNLTHDLSNYYYRSITQNTSLMDANEYYVKSGQTVQCEFSNFVNKPGNNIANQCYFGYPDSTRPYINFTISPSEVNLTNINATRIFSISIQSFLQAYPFNDVQNVSSGVLLSSNVDNFSVTLGSGDKISVGQYYVAPVLVSGGSGGGSGSSLPVVIPPILGSVSPSCPVGWLWNGSICNFVIEKNVSQNQSRLVREVVRVVPSVVRNVESNVVVSESSAVFIIVGIVGFSLFVLFSIVASRGGKNRRR
jgi:parallel beta-helix repeat protein